MITQGARITARCDARGGVLVREVGRFVHRGRLRWGITGECRDRPRAWCEEGTGEVTPEEIRRALLDEHGPARLRLDGPVAGLVPVLRALRETCGLSLARARTRAGELATTGLAGTLVEMEFVAAGLRRRSVAVTVGARTRP